MDTFLPPTGLEYEALDSAQESLLKNESQSYKWEMMTTLSFLGLRVCVAHSVKHFIEGWGSTHVKPAAHKLKHTCIELFHFIPGLREKVDILTDII